MILELDGIPPTKKNGQMIVSPKLKGGSGARGRPFIIPTSEYRAWEKSAAVLLRAQADQTGMSFPIAGAVGVHLQYLVSNKRAWDLSNKAESVMDALVASKIIADDNRFFVGRSLSSWKESRLDGVRIEIVSLKKAEEKFKLEDSQ